MGKLTWRQRSNVGTSEDLSCFFWIPFSRPSSDDEMFVKSRKRLATDYLRVSLTSNLTFPYIGTGLYCI